MTNKIKKIIELGTIKITVTTPEQSLFIGEKKKGRDKNGKPWCYLDEPIFDLKDDE
ncbi:MAG: hypothetical protein ACFFG0_03550 [Candidatus Thorarchaeota archaeon]